MKAFTIDQNQIARIVAGLIADELAWRFKRHTDFLTLASWAGETALDAGGAGLSPAERAACAGRCTRFFGLAPETLSGDEPRTIADWAGLIEAEIRRTLCIFSFTPAGRDSESEACRHPADEIFSDGAAAANLLSGRRRMVSLVAPHNVLGFAVTVVAANLLFIETVDARGIAPDALTRKLGFGDVLVATPTLWRYLLSENTRAPDNAMAVSFGEVLPAELAAEIRKAGFGALRELYGSTETGLIGWRDSPTDSFMIFDQWRREGEGLSRITPGGGARPVEPMDILDWTGERSFRLAGRRDGAVQVGAVNVFPERIAEAIREHPSVEDCRIRVARHDGGVNRLVARIRLNPEVAPTEQTARNIDNWCRKHLRQHERPRIYNFEADLGGD